ncbi:MAG: hypothetical protein ABWY25_02685 [Paenisporosarcina sp.]
MATPFNFLTEAGLGGYKQGRGRVIVPGGSIDDPYNWKQIAADLAAEEKRKSQAQARIRNPTAPKAVAQTAPAAPETPAPSIKELLDAYRAMNNGALPPGTSPEMAAMIDKGIWSDWSMLDGNPQLAQALLSIQGAITGLPAQYQAAKQGILGNYSGITGAIVNPAAAWGQSMTGAMTSDPFNPNAALAGADPALVDYNNTISAISGTAGLNQATDLSWFDKMLQNQLSNYEFMMRSAALPQPVEEEDKGGGGGGGGGGGRGGGGGGGSDWKDPKSTLTNFESAVDTTGMTFAQRNPGFYQAIMAAAESDPELEELTSNLFNLSTQDPRGMTQDTQAALNEAQAIVDNLTQQGGLRTAWEANVPRNVQGTIAKMIAAKGAIKGDDPRTPGKVERYYVPPGATNTGQPIVMSEETMADIALGERLLRSEEVPNVPWFNAAGAAGLGNAPIPPQKDENEEDLDPILPYQGATAARQWAEDVRKYHGFMPSADRLERDVLMAIAKEQLGTMEQVGAEKYGQDTRTFPGAEPLDMELYAQSGGWIPPVNEEELEKNARYTDLYSRVLNAIKPWNQNINYVATAKTGSTKDTDSSKYQTAISTYDPRAALPGSPSNVTPTIPQYSYESNPMMSPENYEYNPDTGQMELVEELLPPEAPEALPFGGGMEARGAVNLPNLSRIAAARLAERSPISVMGKSLSSVKPKTPRTKAAIEAEDLKVITPKASKRPKTTKAPRTKAAIEAEDLKPITAKTLQDIAARAKTRTANTLREKAIKSKTTPKPPKAKTPKPKVTRSLRSPTSRTT